MFANMCPRHVAFVGEAIGNIEIEDALFVQAENVVLGFLRKEASDCAL